jgi:TRAP-type mannitol/chloroaromatic compound transport system permease small subunit
MKGLERFLHYIDQANEKVGQFVYLLLIPLTIVTITEVIARYVFNSPTMWAWDVNLQAFGIVILLSGGYVLLHGRHVRLEAITPYMPRTARLVIELIAMLLIMWVAIVFMWQGTIAGWDAFVARETTSSMWAPPVYHIKMLFPVAGLLLLFQGLANFIRAFLTLLGREG